MNRRGFLSSILKASAGAAVVYSFPSIIVPKNIEQAVVVPEIVMPEIVMPEIPLLWGGQVGMKGLPYIVNSSGDYFGMSRNVYQMTEALTEAYFLEAQRRMETLIYDSGHLAPDLSRAYNATLNQG